MHDNGCGSLFISRNIQLVFFFQNIFFSSFIFRRKPTPAQFYNIYNIVKNITTFLVRAQGHINYGTVYVFQK